MTREELIEFASEISGGDVDDFSADEMQKLTAVMQRLAEFSFDEFKSFGHLCAIRADVDAALNRRMDDLVILRLSREQCMFLLALIDRSIREHA